MKRATYPIFKKVLLHTLLWLLFVIYEHAYVLFINGQIGPVSNIIYFYSCNIGLYYCHYYLLDKTAGRQNPSYALAALLTIGELLVFLLIKMGIEYLVQPAMLPAGALRETLRKAAFSDLLRNLYYAGLATLAWSAGHIAHFRRISDESTIRQLKLEKEQTDLQSKFAMARIAYLQQQLNPHLLFNTLNFVYNTVLRQSEEGAAVLLLLADIMRYSVDHQASGQRVTVAEEVAQMENLVQINRQRFDYPLDIHMEVTGHLNEYQVIPLVLLTLTENIFKHGNFKGSKVMIKVCVSVSGTLSFSTENRKKRKAGKPGRQGTGLDNTRVRLEHYYPSSYALQISEDPDHYRLNLIIQL